MKMPKWVNLVVGIFCLGGASLDYIMRVSAGFVVFGLALSLINIAIWAYQKDTPTE